MDAPNEAGQGTAVDALDRALRAELVLLEELASGLVQQRTAIAADDTATLEQLVPLLSRTLLTLREARRQRGMLVELIAGRADARLSEVLAALPAAAKPGLTELSRALRDKAVIASRELAVNQMVIRRAIESGERFLQHLLTGPAQQSYRGQAEPEIPGGLLLNQRA